MKNTNRSPFLSPWILSIGFYSIWLPGGLSQWKAVPVPFVFNGLVSGSLLAGALLFAAASWKREQLIGSVLFVSSILIGIFIYRDAEHYQTLATWLAAGPFVLGGVFAWNHSYTHILPILEEPVIVEADRLLKVTRVTGLVLSVLWVLLIIAETMETKNPDIEWTDTAAVEGAMVSNLIGSALFGVLAAWKWNGQGGILLMITGVVFLIAPVFTASFRLPENRQIWGNLMAGMIFGLPILLVGAGFWQSWRRIRNTK